MTTLPGKPFPLGATPLAEGVNFALASEVADAVEVRLFDGDGSESRVETSGANRSCLSWSWFPGYACH